MIRLRAVSGLAKAALGASLFTLLVVACDEDGKTVPAKCVDTANQPIFDISTNNAGGPPDYSTIPAHDNPCITNTGHAISPVYGLGGTSEAGADSGGTTAGGTTNGGTNAGGTDSAGADSGGAPPSGADAGAGGS
jgi:hypothetical protein